MRSIVGMGKTYRVIKKPWGEYVVIEKKRDYWIKELSVCKGEALSLQSHKYRNEIWVVLSGKIKVIKGKTPYLLKEGGVIKIDKKEKHRITALEKSLILETAFGRVREDDIIRFEDDYGRK